ncbi:MFS transporter [Prosthecobacter dejongeii]|uniref:NRE family putative nickel resistance protein-like MFS transporter n=1 Tax=Prosthecobacter dejongeii TaxID=48465 RepID=A0A7W7YK31_9BACT|nr:MFS transporter [Prosthecobacter dejongeii]MBB5037559.1 NRE family putative nickel resistance protein-like MFS transporter [Prosthecobacter dejongeii]
MNTTSTSLWHHRAFQQLFWAHALSLVGSGLCSLALGLLAHELVGASASSVLGITLAIRIAVIVLCSPWAGKLADHFGARRLMVASDLMRTAVVIGFFFADAVWQIYALAVLLNLGSAIFTPIYRAVIPGVVSAEQYPRALAIGSIAYDASNILGPSLAALVIAVAGFRGNFILDAVTFLGSAALLYGLPRLAIETTTDAKKAPTSVRHGLTAMFQRKPLRESLFLAFQTSIGGAFVIVATVNFVKNDLHLSDSAYAWVMASFGVGSVVAALIYSKLSISGRDAAVIACAPVMLGALVVVALLPQYSILFIAWWLIGMSYSILGIRGSELLAANSDGAERAHIYAAHFALSHAGWGLTYPLAGFTTTAIGFGLTAWVFAALIALVSAPMWLSGRARLPDGH